MKIMIASDIHGSAYWCRKMIDAFKSEAPDKLILLGDILYHGPRNALPQEYDPKQAAAMLNEIKNYILCVRGNCDSEVDQMMLNFPIMADYCLLYLNNKTIFAAHGHIFNLKNLPPISAGDILLHGHTHVPACESFGNQNIYLNPGSVSIPKQGSANSYIIFSDTGHEFKNL